MNITHLFDLGVYGWVGGWVEWVGGLMDGWVGGWVVEVCTCCCGGGGRELACYPEEALGGAWPCNQYGHAWMLLHVCVERIGVVGEAEGCDDCFCLFCVGGWVGGWVGGLIEVGGEGTVPPFSSTTACMLPLPPPPPSPRSRASIRSAAWVERRSWMMAFLRFLVVVVVVVMLVSSGSCSCCPVDCMGCVGLVWVCLLGAVDWEAGRACFVRYCCWACGCVNGMCCGFWVEAWKEGGGGRRRPRQDTTLFPSPIFFPGRGRGAFIPPLPLLPCPPPRPRPHADTQGTRA